MFSSLLHSQSPQKRYLLCQNTLRNGACVLAWIFIIFKDLFSLPLPYLIEENKPQWNSTEQTAMATLNPLHTPQGPQQSPWTRLHVPGGPSTASFIRREPIKSDVIWCNSWRLKGLRKPKWFFFRTENLQCPLCPTSTRMVASLASQGGPVTGLKCWLTWDKSAAKLGLYPDRPDLSS